MKHSKQLIAIVLALVMALSIAIPVYAEPDAGSAETAVAAVEETMAAEEELTTEAPVEETASLTAEALARSTVQASAWETNDYPTILVHGIGQSDVYLLDDKGEKVLDKEGEPLKGWPPAIDIASLIPPLILPLLGSLLLQHDVALTKTIRNVAGDVLGAYKNDGDGKLLQNYKVEKWHRFDGESAAPTSIDDLPKEKQDECYHHLPLQEMAELVGGDNLYYFSYDSFGNLTETVGDLYKTIDDVMAKHGTSKVNIVPISMGGAVMNALVEFYPDVQSKFYNIVYVIAALDGSRIVGDLYTKQLATDNKSLYLTLLPALVEGWTGNLLNIVLRLLPKRLLKNVLNAVLDGAIKDVLARATMIWALLPQEDFETAAKLWLNDPEAANVTKQIENYHTAQVNSKKNILAMKAAGVNIYAISEYDYPLLAIAGSASRVNSDGIIHSASTSMGATFGMVGEKLPADYTPKTPGYISPDGIVDASTGWLPDHTFFFKEQNHEATGRCDVIMRLTMRLSCSKNAETVTSMPEWPQFNNGRNGRTLSDGIRDAGKVDRSKHTAQELAALDEAVEFMRLVQSETIVLPGRADEARAKFNEIMVKLGYYSPPEKNSIWETVGEKVTGFLSDALYYGYGPRGFIDPIWRIWQ